MFDEKHEDTLIITLEACPVTQGERMMLVAKSQKRVKSFINLVKNNLARKLKIKEITFRRS
jgi:hypothetical protein